MSRLLDRVSAKLKNLVARGLVNLIVYAGDVRRVQISVLGEADTHDQVPAPEPWGSASYPPAGLPGVFSFPAGDRAAGLCLMIVDNAGRPALAEGDKAVYDWRGNKVHLTADGIDVVSPKRIRLIGEDVEIHASRSLLNSVGGYADKRTHVSEGQLVDEVWHEPAIVTSPYPDHTYPLAAP